MSLLHIQNLNVRFGAANAVPVVDDLCLTVDKGEVLAIVGESGSGKSVTMLALMGLIDPPGVVSASSLRFDGHDMLQLKPRQRRKIVGKDLAMVFQDPMTALNPSYTVGFQIEEVLRQHLNLRGKAARQRAIELLDRVEIPAAASRLLPVGSYQVATAPLAPELARSLLPRGSCVIDNQFVPDYFRLTPDQRLLFGGGCTYLGGIPKDVASATRPYLQRVFPQLRGVELEFAWGGHIDVSMKRTPDIGRQGQRYWLQGFSGHGVLPTLAGARAVSDAILGDDELLTLYQAIGNPRFPGGALLAAPLEALGKAWYRLRDVI